MESRTPARRRSPRIAIAAIAAAAMLGLPLTAPSTSWAQDAAAGSGVQAEPAEVGTAAAEPLAPTAPAGTAAAPAAPAGPAPAEPAPPVEPAPAQPAPAPEQPTPTEPEPGDLVVPAPQPAPGALLEPAPAPADLQQQEPVVEPAASEEAELVEAAPEISTQATLAAAPLPCLAGTFFSVSEEGLLQQIVRGTGTNDATVTTIGTAPSVGWGIAAPNYADGLGVSSNGQQAKAFEVTAGGIANLLTYDAATDSFTKTPAPLVDGNDYRLSTGAVNPFNGNYYIGGFDEIGSEVVFELSVLHPDGTYSPVGHIPIVRDDKKAPTGDIAFDSAGNLYLLAGTNKFATYSVTAASLASALAAAGTGTPGQITHNVLRTGLSSMPDSVGMAFDADGTAYVSRSQIVYRYDPGTWATIGNQVTSDLRLTTDLASCSAPSTVTIVKNVVRRNDTSDQFTLTLTGAQVEDRVVTTAGSAVGVQSQQIGPVAVLAGDAYTFGEAMAPGSLSTLGLYASGYACVGTNGSRVAGEATSGTLTPVSGVSYVCTFTNSPLVTSVSIHKTLVDEAGNRTSGAGWPLAATVTSTIGDGTASLAPTGPTSASGTAGEDGVARWDLAYSTTGTRASVSVSETQQAPYVFSSGYCDVTTVSGTTTRTTIGTGATLTLAGIAPGSAIACEYVNAEPTTTLTLRTAVAFGDQTLLSTWDLSATAQTAPALDGPTGKSGASASITPGVGYQLAGAGGPATHLQAGWSCVRADGTEVTLTGDVVTAALGDSLTCTLTFTSASLTLLKHIDGTVPGTIQPDDFTLTAAPSTFLGLADATFPGSDVAVTTGTGANTFFVRPDHDYTLSETSALAYIGVELQRYAAAYPADGVLLEEHWETATASTIRVERGDHDVYRFVNMPVPTLALPLTGGIGADAYLFGGGALLALAALILLVHSRIRSGRLSGRLT